MASSVLSILSESQLHAAPTFVRFLVLNVNGVNPLLLTCLASFLALSGLAIAPTITAQVLPEGLVISSLVSGLTIAVLTGVVLTGVVLTGVVLTLAGTGLVFSTFFSFPGSETTGTSCTLFRL